MLLAKETRPEPFLRTKARACRVAGAAAGRCLLDRSFMCHAAVADSGEQRGRRLLAAGDVGGGGGDRQQPLPLAPVVMEANTAALPALSRGRQVREMSAMVAALARVVAGSAPPDKQPHQAVQEASAEEAWWPYDELAAEPPPAFVLDDEENEQLNLFEKGHRITLTMLLASKH
ncbi:ethylene-responsive transcription factor ABI4-like [Panicum miliaceum]|uniref:Ethylene-responsive transcription factor ABI4-like n=1 Tax=Panicum miliaceum TaxID=4540 RepID=A0A3L6SWN0_PANMI|nr:ethylene-responsive transcription factor ABI4-like [Panicum miliaceum]